MVNKIKKSIANSKFKGEFKKREQFRIEKKQRQAKADKFEFVDKRDLLKKKGGKAAKRFAAKEGKPDQQKKRGAGEEDAEMKKDDESENDSELEQELAEAAEVRNPDLLDETIFNKFATGELDLPEDADDDAESEDDASAAGGDDSELEAYYEELGIDPNEMAEEKTKAGKAVDESKLYRKQKKADLRKEKVVAAKRERNEILDAMMEKARSEPNYKTLTRIIQVVKAVFTEKMDQENKKKGKGADEDMDDQNEEQKTSAHKHKMFSQ